MCLEAGDGGALVKYDVKRVDLGKSYLGIAYERARTIPIKL
jgi:hypothetical protein